MDEATVQRFIERAFGWGPQAYWRGTKVEEVPTAAQVQAVLTYLRSLGLSDAELFKVIKAFPEVLACSVDGQLKEAVSKLEGQWRLQGDVLKRAVLRQPAILGYNYDCEGSCTGDCNRCWVRF